VRKILLFWYILYILYQLTYIFEEENKCHFCEYIYKDYWSMCLTIPTTDTYWLNILTVTFKPCYYSHFKGTVAWDFWPLVFFMSTWSLDSHAKIFSKIFSFSQRYSRKYFWLPGNNKMILRWPHFYLTSNHKPRHVLSNHRCFLYI